MRHHINLSLIIAALFVYGVSEGYPCTSRCNRSRRAEARGEELPIEDNKVMESEQISPGQISFDGNTNNDEAPMEMRGKDGPSSANAPLGDGLLPSLGKPLGNNQQQGGGLSSFFSMFPPFGGGGGGGGGGLMGPMAVLGGFSALVMPMGGPLMNNLPGALSSLMGTMQNLGSLPSLPGIGGSSG